MLQEGRIHIASLTHRIRLMLILPQRGSRPVVSFLPVGPGVPWSENLITLWPESLAVSLDSRYLWHPSKVVYEVDVDLSVQSSWILHLLARALVSTWTP